MRPVEHRPSRAGNPGASRSVFGRHDADASGATAPRAPGGRGMSIGSDWRSRGALHPELGAGRCCRSTGCRGHSGCTTRPGPDSARTGTDAPQGPRAPRPRPRTCWTDASQRATLLWHRLHRHGVGRGAVIKLASSQTAAASTFFGMSDVVSPARSLRRQPIPGNSHDLPQPPRATSLGRPAGRPRLVNTPVDGISQTASLKSAQNEPNYKTATSPANSGGS